MGYTALNALFELPRAYKRMVQVLVDTVLVAFSFALAMLLRTESLAPLADPLAWFALLAALPVSILAFIKLGFYRAVIRYMGPRAFSTLLVGVLLSAVALGLAVRVFGLPVPAAVPFIYAVLAFCTVGGVRLVMRALYLKRQSRMKTPVIIYGAGTSGRQLLSSLDHGQDYVPVAFVDDARELEGASIGGLRVFRPGRIAGLIDEYGAQVVMLAMPSALPARRAAILARLEELPVRVQTVPDFAEMVSGRGAGRQGFREVTVEDLLGRNPVPADPALLRANIAGKVVLVTGAGGTIGSELCRQILRQEPRALILLDSCEYALYAIDQELRAALTGQEGGVPRVVPLLGSVREAERMRRVLGDFAVQTIYHAAAYKHVPLVEQNAVVGTLNNVFGTLALARAAVTAEVESFILISTDKAVRPVNIMGASKRMAELICQALARSPGRTRFSMVRFGNVLDSSGSVVPLFRAQIENGGPVTVTHPEITRYFMTIGEAAQLVIQAGAMAKGGDVFVLDMGRPVRIADLATRMIRLSGYTPVVCDPGKASSARREGVIPMVYTSLRPGEKLYEELLVGEGAQATGHPRIMTATEASADWTLLGPLLDRLLAACNAHDIAAIRAGLAEAPTGFVPRDEIADLAWGARETEGVGAPPEGGPARAAGPAAPDRSRLIAAGS